MSVLKIAEATNSTTCAACNRPIKGKANHHKGKVYGPICYDRVREADESGFQAGRPVVQDELQFEESTCQPS